MKRLSESIAAIIIAVVPLTASAAPIVDFATGAGGPGGTVSVNNANGMFNVSGAGIFIDKVTVTGAPLNNGAFDVDGAGVCADLLGGCGILNFDANLGTLALVGSIPALGILSPQELVSSTTFDQALRMLAQDADGVRLRGSERDSKTGQLVLAIGLDPATTFQFDLFVTGVNGQSPYTVTSTRLTNTPAQLTPVPEPGSLLLIGTGLAGIARAVRHNRRRAHRNHAG